MSSRTTGVVAAVSGGVGTGDVRGNLFADDPDRDEGDRGVSTPSKIIVAPPARRLA
ncbi:hypothetical protein [Frankia sp. CcWB3]